MSRAKTRRPTTRAGTQAGEPRARKRPPPPPSGRRIPTDLPDVAEAALDDLISSSVMTDLDAKLPVDPVTEALDKIDPIYDEDDLAVPTERPGRAIEPPPPPRPGTAPPPEAPVHEAAGAIVDEHALPQLEPLRFAIFEDAVGLAAAQQAIVTSGHVVARAVAAPGGAAKIIEAIRIGGVDIAIVGMAAPTDAPGNRGGEQIIDAALALEPRRPIVIASYTGDPGEAVRRASAAGADLATTRPHDPARLAPVLLAAARLHAARTQLLSARGAEQVLRARLEELQDPEPRGLQPFEIFQRVCELEFKRARRFEYPLSVALFAVDVPPPPPPAGIRGILRARAGNALLHTIRDIDIATQLDHERFLVLLPYTDLKGAAHVGRRVIAAVGTGDPVVSAGRSFPPRLVGAVAGAAAGGELSFSKLMRNATRALEQARRDGAELAVQP